MLASDGTIRVTDQRTLRPCGDYILIEALDEDETTEGGLVVPETARDSLLPCWKVLRVGSGHIGPGGGRVPIECQVGDIVLCHPMAKGIQLPGRQPRQMVLEGSQVIGIMENK